MLFKDNDGFTKNQQNIDWGPGLSPVLTLYVINEEIHVPSEHCP